ncbi:hypothetical protein ACHAW6_004444 [Cyclotella cf. meneghiniana]
MSKRHDDSEGPLLPAPPPRKKRVVKVTLIDHSYTDYSTYQITNADESNKGHCSIDNFPRKLHHILSTPAYHHIISWMPHGRAWKIWNRELLVSVVCKEQFKHEKFESFNRQVNGWGFKRLFRNGPDYKCYYNQFFLRGLPDLTSHMYRLDKPGKRIPNKLEEPDLYKISRMFPLPEINASSATEAPSRNDASVLFDSISLTVPYTHMSSSEKCPPHSLKFDRKESASSYEALYVPSYATAATESVSRESSENKISHWQPASKNEFDPLPGESRPSFLVRHDRRFCQDMDLSLANDTYFSYQTSEGNEAPLHSVEYDKNKRHWEFCCHTEAPRLYNEPIAVGEQTTIISHQQYMLGSHHKVNQLVDCKETPHCCSLCQDNSSLTREIGSEQGSHSCATESWYKHSGHQKYGDWYPAQQQQQKQYYIQHNQGDICRQCSYAPENKGYDLNVHYAQPYHRSDTHPFGTIQGWEGDSNTSQYHHPVQYGYDDQYIAQPQYIVQDAQGLTAYNEPIQPHTIKSYENYARNSQHLDHHQHDLLGFETYHLWQAQHECDDTKQSRSTPRRNSNSKL